MKLVLPTSRRDGARRRLSRGTIQTIMNFRGPRFMLNRHEAQLSAATECGSRVAAHSAHRSSGETPLVVRPYTAT
jgi:hypothetical protein